MKKGWVPFVLPWDDTPIDLSFLYEDEKPAGRHGFLKVKDDKFVFEDGTETRFWGTLFNSAANFPPYAYSEKISQRLAKFGINIVRTHQLDAEWSTPNIFQFTKGKAKDNTLDFAPRSLDRLDYLIYCLKKQGIYTYLDQLTYRRFKPSDNVDAVDHLDEAAKPYSNFNPKLIELQKKYSYDLWTHINPYTGLTYKDDPAIALMEITNENDLFTQQVTLEPYRSRLEDRYRAWAKENNFQISDKKVDFTNFTEPLLRFLHEVQQNYYKEMIEYLRSIGVRVPIAGTNWSRSLVLLSSQLVTDFTDSHSYWDFWGFPEDLDFKKLLTESMKGRNKPMVGEKENIFSTLSFNRVLDKPFFVSEWDQPWPSEWRAEHPLIMAAVGAFQGWGGLTIHTYRYRTSVPVDCIGGVTMGGRTYRRNFDTFNDPAKFGLFYHAALLFRRGDVEVAKESVGVEVSEEIIFKSSKSTMPALTLTSEKHKVGMVLAGQRKGTSMTVPPDKSMVDQCKDQVISDTGQLYRNWVKRIGWIDTPRTKAAYGFLGDVEEISMDDLKLKVKTAFATVAISSLTNEPINESSNLLLTAVGRADNTGVKYNLEHTRQLDPGHGPILIEPIEAAVELATTRANLKVWSVNPEGFFTAAIPTEYKDSVLRFEIGKLCSSMYYLIQR